MCSTFRLFFALFLQTRDSDACMRLVQQSEPYFVSSLLHNVWCYDRRKGPIPGFLSYVAKVSHDRYNESVTHLMVDFFPLI